MTEPELETQAGVLAALLRRSHLMSPASLAEAVSHEVRERGLSDAVVWITDYSQERLVPLPSGPAAAAEEGPPQSVPIDGTIAGLAYTRVQLVETQTGEQPRTYVPLLAGMERLGVLELQGADMRGESGRWHDTVRDLASLIAQLLTSKGLHSDYLESARRQEPMSLAAEMQWALLPPLTFGSSRVIISGLLEPCYEVGGDAFDYALDAGVAVVGIFDAMGHGVEASLLSSLAVGAYRNSRRIGLDLVDTYTEIDRVLSRHRGGEAFVTAVLGRLELDNGHFAWVSAGHMPPLLLRGGKVVKALESEPGIPLGLGGDVPPVSMITLERGDRLLLVTDGVVDARSPDGELFGEDRLIDLVRKATASGYPAAEAMRRLKQEILTHAGEHLGDDATTLFIEWTSSDVEHFAIPPRH